MTKKRTKKTLLSNFTGFQPGFVLGALGLAITIGGVYLGADATSSTTTTACKRMPVTDIAAANPARDQVAYTISTQGQGTPGIASVKAGSDCIGYLVSLTSYKTPALDGLPYIQQTIFDSQSKVTAATVVNFQINMPNCFYQIDLAYGHPIDLTTGANYNSTNLIRGFKGGTSSCAALATPTPTPTPTRTPTPLASAIPTRTATPTPSPTPTPTPVPTATPSDDRTPSPTPVVGGGGPAPTPGPGETEVVPPPQLGAQFLPQTGKAGQLMTILGALLITGGLVHLWLSQRHKLLLGGKKSKK